MAAGTFRVVVSGKTLAGTSAEQAVANFAAMFRVPVERAQSLIGRRAVVKRDVDERTAASYVAALQKSGLEAFFEFAADAPAMEPSPPASSTPTAVSPAGVVSGPAQAQASPPPLSAHASAPPPIPVGNEARAVQASGASPPPLPATAPHTAAYDMDRANGPVVKANEVRSFLQSISLSHLAPVFESHAVTAEMLADLSDQDLQSMGVASLGERKRILGAVRHIAEDEKALQAVRINEEAERAGGSASRGFFITYAVLAVLCGVAVAAEMGVTGFVVAAAITFVGLWIYFLPTQIAFRKQSEHRWLILVGNLFFGGTFFGWIILLLLAKRLVSGKAAAAIAVVGAVAGSM